MFRDVVLCSILVTGLGSSIGFAQTTPTGEQIVQPIIVNGQQAQGVMVIQNGTIQTFTCLSPQPYTTSNQSENGWACLDQTTGMWLLHAQPPQQATSTYQQPDVYVVPPTIPYYTYYPYSYSYYPFGYYPTSRFIVGQRFGFAFGSGYRSPIFVNRPVVRGPAFRGPVVRGPVSGRPFTPGPIARGPSVGGTAAPFQRSAPFVQRSGRSQGSGGSRSFAGFGTARGGTGFGRGGRR
jgi:hypothetical protein